MQPDYTFALQFNRGSTADRAASIRQRLVPDLVKDPALSDCMLYSRKQAQRLVKLTDDLTTLAAAAPTATLRLRKSDVVADVVASNLGSVSRLSAVSRGPFRLCGRMGQL
jgi:hypothetical protein